MAEAMQSALSRRRGGEDSVLLWRAGARDRPSPQPQEPVCFRAVVLPFPSGAGTDCSSLQLPRSWVRATLESPELLQILLLRIKRLIARLRVSLSADFVFSEPHSKRLRLRHEVLNGIVLEETHPVEFIRDRLCDSCSRGQANADQWVAVVQLRKHVPHRRSFIHLELEQLLLKYGEASLAINSWTQT